MPLEDTRLTRACTRRLTTALDGLGATDRHAEGVVIDRPRGIGWHAPADWGSVRSADRRDVARALDDWLHDAEAWEARA